MEPSLFWAGIITAMPPMRLRLGPATLGAGAGAGAVKMGAAMGARLGGLSKSSDEGILSYWGLRAYSCRLEGVMEPSEERWLPTLVKLRAVDTRLLGGGTSSLGWWGGGFTCCCVPCMCVRVLVLCVCARLWLRVCVRVCVCVWGGGGG